MAGEHIFVIDGSAAVRSIAQTALENAGYLVTLAGNGAAALLAPDFSQFDLAVVDAALEGIDGLRTTRELKTDPERFRTPILLLIPEGAGGAPEGEGRERGSVETGGADAYLLKPFSGKALVLKVRSLLEEKAVIEQCQARLRESVNHYIAQMTDRFVRDAVEDRTQLLVERAVQTVISKVDQQAKREIDERVTTLTEEREQELVRRTVHEVAQSLVEKLAQTKVNEAIEAALKESADRTVKRIADTLLPGAVRERLKESAETILPREIELRVRRAAEELVPNISEKIVEMVRAASEKIVPKTAKEKLPELTQRLVESAIGKIVPPMVDKLAGKHVEARVAQRLSPLVLDASHRIQRRANIAILIALAAFVAFSSILMVLTWKRAGGASGDAAQKPAGGKEIPTQTIRK